MPTLRKIPDPLIQGLYDDLREVAGRILRRERIGHTLQKTALVHEAYIRLSENPEATLNARSFIGLAAKQMRHTLVDYARRHNCSKRGGGLLRVPLFDGELGIKTVDVTFLALEQALERLERLDARSHSVVELKYFAGFTNLETAEILGISDGTVEADWQFARTWLFEALSARAVSESRLSA